MAIKIPDGIGFDGLSDQKEVSFVELMGDRQDMLQPPDTSRGDAGAKVDAAVRVLETAIATYAKALRASAGEDHIAQRLALNVKASIRRNSPALAAIIGLP